MSKKFSKKYAEATPEQMLKVMATYPSRYTEPVFDALKAAEYATAEEIRAKVNATAVGTVYEILWKFVKLEVVDFKHKKGGDRTLLWFLTDAARTIPNFEAIPTVRPWIYKGRKG